MQLRYTAPPLPQSRSTVCPLGYCSRELYSLADNSLRKYRLCVRNVAHFWAFVKRRMASSVGHTLFSSQFKINTVQVKGVGTRVLRTDVFLAQDNPSRDAHLNSQKRGCFCHGNLSRQALCSHLGTLQGEAVGMGSMICFLPALSLGTH